MANGTQVFTRCGRQCAKRAAIYFSNVEAAHPASTNRAMYPDTSDNAAGRLELSDVVCEMDAELRCLLGPTIHFATGALSAGSSAPVRVRHEEIVDLLRHLALDAHDAMPKGGTVTIRTGCLHEAAGCAALVIHESPDLMAADADGTTSRIRKGRSLGLGASYDMVEAAGGHFHVSCRGHDTVLTICFPLAV